MHQRAVIHRSDQGSQYTSVTFGNRCRQASHAPEEAEYGGLRVH
jgi:hypothetical protein